ncbi:MAG: hypothetical protein COT73_05410 [Bdellovibrio sp. CG10_big_fil_rev_8_21_14_0_10_47_8]|nr:MAG: hypothetical protein COT73_05410 [Bdellovibrio sp. CG10_big_fil_rev_8_21_14_0_10_47_8]
MYHQTSSLTVLVQDLNLLSTQRGYYSGHLNNGQLVFIKIPRNPESLASEAAWLTRLNGLGLGPRYHGTTMLEGKRALVMDFVPGAITQFPMAAPADIVLTPGMIREMKRQVNILYENQIWPLDLQFIVNQKRQVVITDPELFKLNSSYTKEDYDKILTQILILWKMDDRIID